MNLRARRLKGLHRQVVRLERRLLQLQAASDRLSNYRLAVFFGGFALGAGASFLVSETVGGVVLALAAVTFFALARLHRQIEKKRERHCIWLDLKRNQLARMNLDWANIPAPAEAPANPDHPFEVDLDITGPKSLHQLVDLALSRDGSLLLQRWLLEPEPELRTCVQRQAVVKELVPLARFRDKLLLAFRLVSKDALEGKELLHLIARSHPARGLRRVLLISAVLAVANLALFVAHQLGVLPPYWVATLTLYGILYFWHNRYTKPLLHESVFITEELKKFRALSRFLETYPYGRTPRLRELCAPFWQPETQPSRHLRAVTALSTAVGLRMNPMVQLLLNAAVPWDFLCAHALHAFKARLAQRLPVWLEVLSELEAFVSLANFAYLNPDYAFPELAGEEEGFVFHAEALGHPLLPADRKVCNDFAFEKLGEIALITGSNMSGKSTFLKTLGVNLCLAFAGSAVNARALRTSLFRLFTCIQIHDSVTEGFSFFYAEVKRLKALLTALEQEHALPLFCLIDEIFKGTNNRERYLGGRAYIEALAGKHGVGVVSTHDLDLTRLAETIPHLTNYHFKEHVENGKMVFDFKLRPGPCPTTNALKIMQMEGLPVRTD